MVKNTSSISSDLDFIKEFEELKIKQKLLIESLKKKGQTQQTNLFMEINSKLDFLVKIFKEANSSDENDEMKAHFENFATKIEGISKKFDERFDELNDKIEEMKTSEEIFFKEKSVNIETASDEPPKPDFESKIEDAGKTQDNELKKRKWF